MEQTELESKLLALLAQPMRMDEMRRALPETGKNELKDALDRLIADGQVMKNKKNRFALCTHYGCVAGTYLATERAFAFVAPDAPADGAKPDDLFIPPGANGGAWHGDRVLVKLSERKNNRGRQEGTVIRVLRRADRELTGALVQRGNAYFVQPSSKKYPEIAVDRHHLGDAQPPCRGVHFLLWRRKTAAAGRGRSRFGRGRHDGSRHRRHPARKRRIRRLSR